MAKNKFEELLASINGLEDQDRQALLNVTEKHPELRDGWLRQNEFSRNMDDLTKQRKEFDGERKQHETILAEHPRYKEYHERMQKWWDQTWVPDAYGKDNGATKRELEKDALIKQLQSQVEVEMTFEDLNKEVSRLMDERKFVGQESFEKALAEKEAGVREYLDRNITGMSQLVVKGPKVAVKHFREFNEELDLDELVKFANDNKIADVEQAYNRMVEPKIKEREAKGWEAKVEQAKVEAREQALKEAGMTSGKLPTDTTGPEMSHFQRFISKTKGEEEGKTQRVVPDDVEFGRGHVAQYAAPIYEKRAAEQSAS